MISSRCIWISGYLPWRTAHAFEPLLFFCNIVSALNHVNCPVVICLPCIAVLSSFGRETSLVNIMGPRSIFPSLFTPSIYLLLLLSSRNYHYYYLFRLTLCKQQGRRDCQPL